jgi:hypothetical protein
MFVVVLTGRQPPTSRDDIDSKCNIAGEHQKLMILATEHQAEAAVEELSEHIGKCTDMLLARDPKKQLNLKKHRA